MPADARLRAQPTAQGSQRLTQGEGAPDTLKAEGFDGSQSS